MRFRVLLAPVRTGLLVVAALAAAAGCGRRISDSETAPGDTPSGQVLAEVGRRVIHESDLERRLSEIPPLSRSEFTSPAGQERLLRQMIEEELLWRAAQDEGVSRDPAVVHEVERATRSIVVQAYLDRKQQEASQVTEEEARAFYEEHLADYVTEHTVRVRVLENPRLHTAEHARTLVVEQNVSMASVCSKFNVDPSLVEAAGLLPQWVRRGKAVPWIGNHPSFHEAAFALEPGVPSEVFETARGWTFVMLEEDNPSRQRSFEEARADVEGRIARQRTSTGLPELLASLEERYRVRIEAVERSAEEVFAEAQRATNPREAVVLFEEVVERWPDHERVPEALFMIGFKRTEELDDPVGAEAAFRELLERFPDSELAQSARWMLSSDGDGTPEFEPGKTASPEESAP